MSDKISGEGRNGASRRVVGEASGLARKSVLEVRRAAASDVPALIELSQRVFAGRRPCEYGHFRGRLDRFPEGQFVACHEGRVVGFCSTFRVSEESAYAPHAWAAISGEGYASGHDNRGLWLYEMESGVDPAYRRLRVAQRLADARKQLARERGLKGVVVGVLSSGLARRQRAYPQPAAYFDAVRDGRIKDPAVKSRISEGFEFARLLEAYAPDEAPSGGLAALMVWRNPDYAEGAEARPAPRRAEQIVRVTAVQLEARPARSVGALLDRLEYFVAVASDLGSDFVVFPEHFALALLAGGTERVGQDAAMAAVAEQAPALVDGMSALAVRYEVNVIGGSFATRRDGELFNVAYACLRDGAVVAQDKLHVTPDERDCWRLQGGARIDAFETDCGPVAMLICYDSEFPELARRVVDQGARILFVPYATDDRQGHLRVKLCCQARAIENQVFVVTAGNVGNLPNVENMDLNYAQSGVYTPCDYGFARDGVAVEADPNIETATTTDLDLRALARARSDGSVRNFRDRRFDLYKTVWRRHE